MFSIKSMRHQKTTETFCRIIGKEVCFYQRLQRTFVNERLGRSLATLLLVVGMGATFGAVAVKDAETATMRERVHRDQS